MGTSTGAKAAAAAIAAAGAGVAAKLWKWRSATLQDRALFARRQHLATPVDDPMPVVHGFTSGTAPYKVLESQRCADGDAYLLGVADAHGDVYYVVMLGLPPVAENRPDFEDSLEALLEADHQADHGDEKALEMALNTRYLAFEVPEHPVEQKFVREVASQLVEVHADTVAKVSSSDPEALLNSVEGGWLFASPLRRGRAKLEQLK